MRLSHTHTTPYESESDQGCKPGEDSTHERGRQCRDGKDNDSDSLMESLKATAAACEVKNKVLVMPARVACTGSKVGPSLYHLMEVLGQAEVLKRFDAALARM